MFEDRTVLVLGAGASMGFGFPSGEGLTKAIIDGSRGGAGPYRTLLENMFDRNELDQFHHALFHANRRSIDAFLEHRPTFLDIGKAAIATVLLPHELHAQLFPHGGWYQYLLERMPEDLAALDGRLGIVTFNYDRSLEHFLYTAIQHRRGIPAADAAKMVASLPVVHVYGSLGPLPFQAAADDLSAVAFGAGIRTGVVSGAASQIRIVHERGEMRAAHELLKAAQRIMFLGFGYDRTNLDRLLAFGPRSQQRVVGSARGLRRNEIARVLSQMYKRGWQMDIDNFPFDDRAGDILEVLRTFCWFDN